MHHVHFLISAARKSCFDHLHTRCVRSVDNLKLGVIIVSLEGRISFSAMCVIFYNSVKLPFLCGSCDVEFLL